LGLARRCALYPQEIAFHALQRIFYRIAPNKIFQRNTGHMLCAPGIVRASNQHSPLI